ncbi:hypothetical protein [Gelidibacter salicanalis]|uniref:Uncharacterized protein n=1 Tax=Gelidibacter salicanalis TaxID=291193 RepID=A0A934KS03_9FLAO|nr:hypothetical protein [Gelidibacter salicanalis]MBJ7879702.1 hypothetical protein [Gelidibacter salicanalis]
MKTISLFSTIAMLLLSASKCSETQKLQKKAPLPIEDVYVENWTSQEASGHSGYTLYIPINSEDKSGITLDSVYFRNQTVKLIKTSTDLNTAYVGRFEIPKKSNPDIILSSDPLEEMQNKPPRIPTNIPFKLEPTEGIVSYKVNGETRYYKIEGIIEKDN